MEANEQVGFGAQDNEDGAMQKNADDEFDDDENAQSSELATDSSQLLHEETHLNTEIGPALTKLASRLCTICQSLCRGEVKVVDLGRMEESEYHPSLSSLRRSVAAGCPLCRDLAQLFEQCLDLTPEVRDTVTDSWFIKCSQYPILWTLEFDGVSFHFTFYDSNGQSVSWEPGGCTDMTFFHAGFLSLGPEYSEYNAMSTPNIRLAQYWFNKCLDDCDCRDEALPKILPTRLIELRTHGGASSNTMARLREAKDFSAHVSYLTLSHCWGNNSIFTLTTGNLKTLKRDIPVHRLPDLFKDVLYMNIQLGMKYIWIDCLCILQDCEDDWACEAARMGDVYRYAQCNIAASGYKDSKTGLFKERTPLPKLNFPLYLDLVLVDDRETVGHNSRTSLKGFHIRADDKEFYNAIRKGPLNSRGWVAQERALSPAILHFTPKQMWWECRGHTVNESFPYIDIPWDLGRESRPEALRSLSAESPLQDVYLAWNNFLSFYAGTNLTYKSDRFPALIGIARILGIPTQDNFIAGFWEGDLIQSLAWTLDFRAKEIPSMQLAPSWSWASLCEFHESAYNYPDFVTSLCTCRRILSDDPGFGSDLHHTSFEKSAVRGLEITGPLRKLPVKAQELSELSELRDCADGLEVDVFYDVADSSFFSVEDIASQPWHWEEETHMLPLIRESPVPKRVACLLLNKVSGAQHTNTFRRLGVVSIKYQDQDSLDELLGIDNGKGKSKPSTVFKDCGLHDLILI